MSMQIASHGKRVSSGYNNQSINQSINKSPSKTQSISNLLVIERALVMSSYRYVHCPSVSDVQILAEDEKVRKHASMQARKQACKQGNEWR